jgi:hypothetical protein
MNSSREEDEFRRIAIVAKIERREYLINQYWTHLTHYRKQINELHQLLGRIGQRLGEPEPGEPK